MSESNPVQDLKSFVQIAEHKLDQRLQGQYTNEQILGMLLKMARDLMVKHSIPAVNEVTPVQGVELGEGLLPLDVLEGDQELGFASYKADERAYSFGAHIGCRERQLKASLLREKGLRELLREIRGDHDRRDTYADCACWVCVRINQELKAAVTGE